MKKLLLLVTTLALSLAAAAQTYDGPAALPQITIDSSMAATPAPGAVTQVPAGTFTDIQNALNAANCGDTLELAEGYNYSGSTKITFPVKSCDDAHWIIVRTSAPDSVLPPEGIRFSPCFAGVASLPGRPAYNCRNTNDVASTITYTGTSNGPFVFADGANHYRFIGLEITRAVGTGYIGGLAPAGLNVNHIIWDRVWLHGTPQDETDFGVGISNEQYISFVDGTYTDFHCIAIIGACSDAHPIGGGLDTVQAGPFKIDHNFLEGSAQGILLGGGAATFSPADITITHNHFFKPLTWLRGQPNFVGGNDPLNKCNNGGQCPFIVKNHFELKNAQRVLFDGNHLENTWGGFSQVGFSILLTPKNQAGPNGTNLCPLCVVQDITIRYNEISHAGAGVSLANAPSDNGGYAAAGQRYSIHDITIDDVSATNYVGSGGILQILSDSAEVLNSLTINHVTIFPDVRIGAMGGPLTNTMTNLIITNSIITYNNGAIISTGGGVSNCAYYDIPLKDFNLCAPSSYTFAYNAIVAEPSFPASDWPAGNFFPATNAAIGFVNYNNGNGGDYHLLPSSPYYQAGSDGKDLGADINTIDADIAIADSN